jgi:hypothetical protein
MEITSGRIQKPRKTVIHGEHGTGKTTWASRYGKKTLFICTEEGTNDLDVDRLPLSKKYSDVIAQIGWLIENDGAGYDTVVLDSIDWAEAMVEKDLVDEDFDQNYGKGVVEIASRLMRILNGLSLLIEKGVSVIVIAHSQQRKIEMASGGAFDRVEPKLTKRANAKLLEWADEILFSQIETIVRTESSGFNGTRGVGVTTGRRVICPNPSGAYMAKNRCPKKLPESIDMNDVEGYRAYFA